ncbi:MAG: FeoA family protein [Candidatus Thermoplasmatota archaeon]
MEKRLSDMDYDEKGIVTRIESKRFKARIAGMGIRIGKKLRMVTRQPIKGPVVVEVDMAEISMGIGLARNIIVKLEVEE